MGEEKMEPNWMVFSDGDCLIGLGRMNFREVVDTTPTTH